MLVFALDPAKTGGGVLCKAGDAIAAVYWKDYTSRKRRVYTLACVAQGGDVLALKNLTSAWDIGMQLRRWLGPLAMAHGGGKVCIAAEAPYVGRNPRTGLHLARFGGALVGPLESLDPNGQASWAEPSVWRAKSFRKKWWGLIADEHGAATNKKKAHQEGIAFMSKREAAKAEAARVMPILMPSLQELASTIGGEEHIYDAAGVAYWRASLKK